jgi:squalene-associated FAD-dependent desaturase
MRLLIVGGGWAGLSAAVRAVQLGWHVTLVEASRQLGGRARAIDHHDQRWDNGQHILIGAYRETLALMRELGLDPNALLRRLPLTLQRPDGQGLTLPDVAAPWNLLLGVCRASGWTWHDRLSLLRVARQWQRHGFVCPDFATVAEVCAGVSSRVMDQLIEPLCVSALNTPSSEASGAVFLRVLRDGLWSGAGGSDLLLPTTDLGAVLPDAAHEWLLAHGAHIELGYRWSPPTPAQARNDTHTHPSSPSVHVYRDPCDVASFDARVLACPAWDAARLTATSFPEWSAQAQALRHAPITTVYLRHPEPNAMALPHPMLALPSDAQHPAQFVFDRGQWMGPSQRGVLACVVSHSTGTREALEQRVLKQVQDQLRPLPGCTDLDRLRVELTVVEKRATFVCSPGIKRPAQTIGPGWWACGDYTDGPYPSTLEGAVRSGREVIDQIAQRAERDGRL